MKAFSIALNLMLIVIGFLYISDYSINAKVLIFSISLVVSGCIVQKTFYGFLNSLEFRDIKLPRYLEISNSIACKKYRKELLSIIYSNLSEYKKISVFRELESFEIDGYISYVDNLCNSKEPIFILSTVSELDRVIYTIENIRSKLNTIRIGEINTEILNEIFELRELLTQDEKILRKVKIYATKIASNLDNLRIEHNTNLIS